MNATSTTSNDHPETTLVKLLVERTQYGSYGRSLVCTCVDFNLMYRLYTRPLGCPHITNATGTIDSHIRRMVIRIAPEDVRMLGTHTMPEKPSMANTTPTGCFADQSPSGVRFIFTATMMPRRVARQPLWL